MSEVPAGLTPPRMRVSASRLGVWSECALQARFKYIDHLPSQTNAFAAFGSCVHHALADYNRTGNLKRTLDVFGKAWDDPGTIGAGIDVWPSGINFGGAKQRGVDMLTGFHEKQEWEPRDVLAIEHRFLVPFGSFEITGAVDCLEMKRSGRGKSIVRIVDYKTNRRQPYKNALNLNVQFCVDEETEILTQRGWVQYTDLVAGEDVLTLDQDRDLAQWQPVEAVNVFPISAQTLLLMEGRSHSSLTTLDHRWPVDHLVCGHGGWRREHRIVRSADLTGADRIPCAAPLLRSSEAKWSDAFVELVAWFWTEGWWTGSGAAVAQSEAKHPDETARVRACLVTLFGASMPSLGSRSADPQWRETPGSDVTRFFLNQTARRLLEEVVIGPDKIVTPEFLVSLTTAQMNLFIDTSIAADGYTTNGCRLITQSVKARLDAFQMACSLAGIRTSLSLSPVRGQGRYAGREQWKLALLERRRHLGLREHTNGFSKRLVEHTGHVWCPTTGNGTWLARRNGFVYFTGNTLYDYASRQKEFWVGNGDEFPPMENGAYHWEFLKDVAKRGVWYHLETQKEFDVGARQQIDYERAYRVCQMMERAQKYNVFVPTISGDTCTFCPYTKECGLPVQDIDIEDEDEWL